MNHRFISLGALAILSIAVCAGGAFAQAQAVGYTEDFETFTPCGTSYSTVCALPNGWTNLSGDDHDWLPDAAGTGSTGTGPSIDFNPGTSTGIYLYTETSGGVTGVSAVMESPRLEAIGIVAPRINFATHMWGSAMGTMHIDIREIFNEGIDGDLNGTTFTSLAGNFGSLHIGSSIVISGSAMGNDGSYVIASINSPDSVEVTVAFPAAEMGVSYVHETTMQDIFSLSGNMGDVWMTQNVGVPLIRGGTIEQFHAIFRSERGTSFTSDMSIDDFFYDEILADDLAVTAVLSPSGLQAAGTSTVVSIEIFNNGLNPQSSFNIQYDVNASGSPVIEPYAGPTILAGGTAVHTFATPYVIVAGPNVIDGTVLLGDLAPGNDTASVTVNGVPVISSYPYVEDFEAGTGFWTPGGNLSSWAYGTPAKTVITAAASGLNCWGTGGLTGTYNTNEVSTLTSPVFDLSGLQAPFIRFNIWWQTEFSWDGLALETSIDNGASWQLNGNVGSPNSSNWYNDTTINGLAGSGNQIGWSGRISSGNGSGGYLSAMNDLGDVAGQSNVLVRFIFGSDGSVVDEGVAIDDIEVFEQGGGTGQFPQRGAAVMDINNAVDLVGGFNVASGVPGLYMTSVLPGDPVNFHFEGAAGQPIVLISGASNPLLAGYPGIGTIDVGTALGMSGIPTGLSLIADGNRLSFPDVAFRLDGAGEMDATFPMLALPPGYFTTFQALMFTGGPTVVALSNAVELHAL